MQAGSKLWVYLSNLLQEFLNCPIANRTLNGASQLSLNSSTKSRLHNQNPPDNQPLRHLNDSACGQSFFSLQGMDQNENIVCPFCGDQVDKLFYRYHIDNEKVVVQKIREHNPAWTEHDGACSRCVDYYHTEVVMQQRILPEVGDGRSARNRNRTCTSLRTPDFESGASTNSAIRASGLQY